MPIEVEKKYRLTKKQRETILRRLPELGAVSEGEEFEENILYSGAAIDISRCVLRLRRVGDVALLTYKERLPSLSSIKQQREDETEVSDADAMADILDALGLVPALIYEKRRATWLLGGAEIVIDELPFGLFMEIEASEDEILKVERLLDVKRLRAEMESYPRLTAMHGHSDNGIVEARFAIKRSRKKGPPKERPQ